MLANDVPAFRNYWYPVAYSTDVDTAPFAARLPPSRACSGGPRAAGRCSVPPTAARTAPPCPHRGGWRRDAVCPCHGWRYDTTGTCTAVPAQRARAPRLSDVSGDHDGQRVRSPIAYEPRVAGHQAANIGLDERTVTAVDRAVQAEDRALLEGIDPDHALDSRSRCTPVRTG